MSTIDKSAVIATMTTMEETILSKGAPTTSIANASAGTPQDTTIADKTTTANTATAVATSEGSIAYKTRSARTATTKTKDTTIDTGAAIATTTDVTKKDTTIDTGAAIATTTDMTTNNDERKRGMLLELQAMIAKNAKTTMPEINNAATMTGTPIAATTSTSGSVADHGSSESVAENDLGQTTKGNKKVSIISDMFLFPKWN